MQRFGSEVVCCCRRVIVCERMSHLETGSDRGTARDFDLLCSACGQAGKRDELLIDQEDPAFSWQGSLILHCHKCVQDRFPDQKRFKKACKKSWEARKYKLHEVVAKRARSLAWEEAKKDIGEQHPGESRKAHRQRVCEATYNIAKAIKESWEKHLTPAQQAESDAAWEECVARYKADPTDGNCHNIIIDCIFFSDQSLQYCADITTNMQELFMCRQRS